VHSVQHNTETIKAYFERLKQLYGQVQLTKGCDFGAMSRKTLELKGLENGAYHEILGPWVKKVLAGQHKIKIETATMEDIQSSATNSLVTSRFYKDNTIQSGKFPNQARAVTEEPTSSPGPSNSMLEEIFDRIRKGDYLNGSQARWIRETYFCIHCFSKTNSTEKCHKLEELFTITRLKSGPGGSTRSDVDKPRPDNRSRTKSAAPHPGSAAGRQATAVPPVTPIGAPLHP
jgi:hypothetical protein